MASNNLADLFLMIWNVGGCNSGEDKAKKKKKGIYDVITKLKPGIVMIQEFHWENITSDTTWGQSKLPINFQYIGYIKEAGILYDTDKVDVENVCQYMLDNTRKKFKQFNENPLPRMCIKIVKTKGEANVRFLCVSWHGPNTGYTKEQKENEFNQLVTYIKTISEQVKLPFVLAGDFNIGIKCAIELCPADVSIYEYQPTKRRLERVIDFYVTSDTLLLDDIKAVSLKSETHHCDPATVQTISDNMEVLSLHSGTDYCDAFDHDPVVVKTRGISKQIKATFTDRDEESSVTLTCPYTEEPKPLVVQCKRCSSVGLEENILSKQFLKINGGTVEQINNIHDIRDSGGVWKYEVINEGGQGFNFSIPARYIGGFTAYNSSRDVAVTVSQLQITAIMPIRKEYSIVRSFELKKVGFRRTYPRVFFLDFILDGECSNVQWIRYKGDSIKIIDQKSAKYGGGNVEGPKLTVRNITKKDSGTYCCKIKLKDGMRFSLSVTVDIIKNKGS